MKVIDVNFSDAAIVARDICLSEGVDDSISTCYALHLALKKFGFETKFLVVNTLVFNPFITKEFKPNNSPSKKRLNELLQHKKGYSLTLGMEESTELEWKGHLILYSNKDNGLWLIDPTLNQLSCSEHNIFLSPIGISFNTQNDDASGLDGKNHDFVNLDGTRLIVKLNGSAVMYTSFPSNKSYEQTLNWQNALGDSHIESIANLIFEQLISDK